MWTAIVVTCRDVQEAQTFQKQLELRQQNGIVGKNVILLALEDPKFQVGSGGATLNALLVVTEHICARSGYTVVNGDVLQEAKILILHIGRRFVFDPCGRAFVELPLARECEPARSPVCNIDLLLHTMTKMGADNPPGLWVCSTDMFIDIPHKIDTTGGDVCVVSVLGTHDYATNHGVLKLDQQGGLQDVIYQAADEELRRCALPSGKVPLVSGIQYLNPGTTEKLLSFHTMPPLDACTYMGLDSGAQPIKISLFFDLLLPMCGDVTEQSFISGSRSGPYGKRRGDGDGANTNLHIARALLWKHLHSTKVKVVIAESGVHSYMDNNASTHAGHLLHNPVILEHLRASKQVHSFVHAGAVCDESSVLINSRLTEGVHVGKRCSLSHSYIHQPLNIGDDSVVKGVYTIGLQPFQGTILPEKLVLQTFHIQLPGLVNSNHIPVVTVLGRNDNLERSLCDENATYCNQGWLDFLQRTSITAFDLWPPDMPKTDQTLLNARLFAVIHPQDSIDWSHTFWLCGAANLPNQLDKWRESWRLSLKDILQYTDIAIEFGWRQTQFSWIAEQIVKDTIVNQKDTGLNKLYKAMVMYDKANQMLQLLDKVGLECDNPGVAARVLANIADVLGAMAQDGGGLRSGPALNQQWKHAFSLLEAGSLSAGITALSKERENWLSTSNQLIRAARHYEGAAQILIRHAVMTARTFIRTVPTERPSLDTWVTVECPARIDIAGGWSDTPPITYEHGGSVINAAILLDEKRPIGAKVRKIQSMELQLHIGLEGENVLIISELPQMGDYLSPQAPGALLKAAFICADIIQYPSHISLQEQLQKQGGGFELRTWSKLPHGSGLGTSSILAGAVMAALWQVSGQKFDIASLNHAVLHLEQMLTTGGGWQDQVGGLTPGIKVGHSAGKLPLKVEMTYPNISKETVQAFSDRLVLIYTGKTRLARNLLQNVIRNWYARDPAILQTEDNLVDTAWKCAKAFEEDCLEKVGECMNEYWVQKKHMAPGCEPQAVTYMMQALRTHAHGMSLAGAGGGGFLYVLLKQPKTCQQIKDILRNVQGISIKSITVHNTTVDLEGMVVSSANQGRIHIPMKLD